MENIRQAVERARIPLPGSQAGRLPAEAPRATHNGLDSCPRITADQRRAFQLDLATLKSKRIVAHDSSDPRSKPFDMLRTQVLQAMDLKHWKALAVTSPTPGCGKTVTSINLALSIARQPERQVLLVDLDLQRPQIANYLGMKSSGGLLGTLAGQTPLSDAIVEVQFANQWLRVLPTGRVKSGSSEFIASPAMREVIQSIRSNYSSCTVIFDAPPVLSSDDVITIIPQIDCVLLVTAVGLSSVRDISEANKHLQSVDVVRVVLNKMPEVDTYYYY